MKKVIACVVASLLLLATIAPIACAACNHDWSFSWGYTTCQANSTNSAYCNKITVRVYQCTKCNATEDRSAGWVTMDHKKGASGCNFGKKAYLFGSLPR